MGRRRTPPKVKLITGIISGDEKLLRDIRKPLERLLRNKVDLESPVMDFDKTNYYKEEMGPTLKRIFYGFERLVDLDNIYKVKIGTNRLEEKLSRYGKRTINIDPGYIDMAKLVLFSTKDFTHRIHVGSGIYAEVTLHYRDRSFNPWPWTYPDYQSKEYLEILHKFRDIYKEQIKVS
jgi:hypothetical protein